MVVTAKHIAIDKSIIAKIKNNNNNNKKEVEELKHSRVLKIGYGTA
jgi:uncharacterized protein YdcH (DUF465 family)